MVCLAAGPTLIGVRFDEDNPKIRKKSTLSSSDFKYTGRNYYGVPLPQLRISLN